MRALIPLLVFSLLAAPFALAKPPPSGAVIREPGAIYLEDLVPKPVQIEVLADAPIFYQSGLDRYLGTLRGKQKVELQAVMPHAYRVKGMARQGQVAGWIEAKHLQPLKKEFLESLKQNAARQEEVAPLIARNEIAINMTPEEVSASLGKPPRKSSRLDATGRHEVWEFIKYDRVPQETTGYDRFGRLVSSIIYVKVPVGKLSVTFDKNLVSAIEQTEGTLAHDARVKIVAAPFVVDF